MFHKKIPQDKKFHKILYPPYKKIIKKYIPCIIKKRKSFTKITKLIEILKNNLKINL